MQQRLAAVGEMAAGIAHEIRNPLASMSGSMQILRQELPLSDEQSQLMDIVLRESDRLNETIRSFLAYARPQRNASARLDVRQVVTDTGDAAAEQPRAARDARGPLRRAARAGLVPGRRGADPADRLEPGDQRPAGDGRGRDADARGGTTRGAEPGKPDMITLAVTDEGIGIAPDGARRHPAAVPRRVRARHRPRPVDRPPHRQRLRRRAAGDVRARQRHDGDGEAAAVERADESLKSEVGSRSCSEVGAKCERLKCGAAT